MSFCKVIKNLEILREPTAASPLIFLSKVSWCEAEWTVKGILFFLPLYRLRETVNKLGHCVVVASEGIKNNKNKFLAGADTKDAFGHAQLGGVAPFLANLISQKLKLKNHWAVADYLQRSARHISSKVDLEHAEAVGRHAVKYAVKGMNGIMPVIKRKSTSKYSWEIVPAKLSKIANVEKKLPKSFITKDGFGITRRV